MLPHPTGTDPSGSILLAVPPPRDGRFGSPLKLSKVHWVRPEVVVEVTYLTWTEPAYQGQREDKPARQVVRANPHPLDRIRIR